MRQKLLGALVVCVAMAAGGPAAGQESGSFVVRSTTTKGGLSTAGAAFSRETVERMCEALGLDEMQREVAMEMFRDLASRRQELGDRLRQDIASAKEDVQDGDFSVMITRMKEMTDSYQESIEALEATYLADVQVMLTADQADAWPAAERIHRRAKHLKSLTRSEARVDLDELVREFFAEGASREAIIDAVERWAVHVDGLLVERARKAEDIGGADAGGAVFIFEDGDDPYEPLRAIDGRIAQASRQAVRTLAGILEDDAIEAAFHRRAFARVFKQTDGERRLEAALALETLSQEQREQLDAAADQWMRDAGPARERWVAAEREREEDNRLPPGVMIFVDGQEPSDSEKARDAVKDLDERLEARIASILSAEQLAELPERAMSDRKPDVVRVTPGGESIRIRR